MKVSILERGEGHVAPLEAANEPMRAGLPEVLAALAQVQSRIERIERLLTGPRREVRGTPPRLLSLRAAASLLGIDRGTTLKSLIEDGTVRTVVVAGQVKVPLSEVERLEREGTARRSRGPQPRATRLPPLRRGEPPLARDEVARISAIRV